MSQYTVEDSTGVLVELGEDEPIRVLHVDDDSGFLKIARQCLEMEGNFRVDTASSVEEGMKKLENKTYDVVVSDFLMPGKDGLEFLKELRDSGNTVSFIIFTGKGRGEVAIKALNLGAGQYLNKNGDPETVYGELAHSIHQAVKSKKAEEKLRESEERYRRLVELAPDGIVTLNMKGVVTSCNTAAASLTGYSKDAIVGKHFTKLRYLWASDTPKYLKMFYSAVRGKLAKPTQIQCIRKDGTPFWVEARFSFLKKGGKTTGFQIISRDITERRKGEEERKKLLHDYGERAKELGCLFKMSKLVENPSVSLEEILRGTTNLLPSAWQYPDVACARIVFEKREFRTENFKETRRKQSADIKVHGKKAGTLEVCYLEKPTLDEGPFLKEERDLIDAVAERLGKISERKKAEERIRKAAEEWRKTFDAISDLMYILDKDFRLVQVNKATCAALGKEPKDLIGKKCYEVIHGTDEPWLNCPCKKTLATKEATTEEVNDPHLGASLLVSTSPIFDDNGELTGCVHIAKDISERKKMLEKLEITNEKLSVVGSLTRHDVRNKLSAVTGNVYLAKKMAGDPKVQERLSDIESACRQAVRIFDFARTYERLGAEELAYVDVWESFEVAISLFSDLHGAKIVNDCRGLTVLADSLLNQLFYNLVDNSLKHGGKISQIRVRYEEAGKNQLKLVYEDDGLGIPKVEKAPIFKEGYGKGTGYGLYLIRKICEVYGWVVRETGTPGKGAQFTITIPKVNENGKTNYQLN